jgi:haloalkane dehalogenase
VTVLPEEVVAAYDAPFPSARYKAGARAFPTLVPVSPDDPASDANREAWKIFASWQKPFLTTFSNRDPITRGGEVPWQKTVPGARNQEHVRIKNAGHFLQEDKGPELAEILIKFISEA